MVKPRRERELSSNLPAAPRAAGFQAARGRTIEVAHRQNGAHGFARVRRRRSEAAAGAGRRAGVVAERQPRVDADETSAAFADEPRWHVRTQGSPIERVVMLAAFADEPRWHVRTAVASPGRRQRRARCGSPPRPHSSASLSATAPTSGARRSSSTPRSRHTEFSARGRAPTLAKY